MRIKYILAILMLCILSITGCKGKDIETMAPILPVETPLPSPSPTAPPEPTPEPGPDLTGKRPSALTGEWIDEEIAARRPVAVVINNRLIALPQSGISQAGAIYEVLSEGDITRLVAVFDNFDSQKIGPVRSTRDYFIDFALDHDALFVHHGGSETGYAALRRLNIDRIDGMTDARAFWRDQKRANSPGMYEHSSYTGMEILLEEFERKNARTDKYEDFTTGWAFYPIEALPLGGMPATKITVPFSRNYTAVFRYDPEEKIYYKCIGFAQEPQIDEETGEQLKVTNVLVQHAKMHVIAGDTEGRRNVTTVGQGDGYLFTGGECVPVTWKKESQQSPTRWYDEQGNLLRLNIGKTWICVHQGEITFEGEEQVIE